jgi:hypothetical protein
MKTKTYFSILMLLLLMVAGASAKAQTIIGYSDFFTFDTRLEGLQGIVSNASNGGEIAGAVINLTGQSQNFSAVSMEDGSYFLGEVPIGYYNLSVFKAGFQQFNQNTYVTGDPEQTINVNLVPSNSNFLVINPFFTAYADVILETTPNLFMLTGNVNINNVLYFGGSLMIDKSGHLQNAEIYGIGNIFVPNVGGQDKVISNGTFPFRFFERNDTLFTKSSGYFFDLPVYLGGFPLTMAAINLPEGAPEARILALPKIPYPIDFVINEYLEMGIPTAVKNTAATLIYSMATGENFEVNISNLKANLGIVAIKDLNLYYYSDGNVFGGNLLLKIPGTPKKPKKEIEEAEGLLVSIKNEENEVVHQTSFFEFVETMRILGSDFIEIYMEIEFVSGALNNLAVTLSGTHIPIFTTGLFITEIQGGVYNLANEKWHVEASVDIDTGLSIPAIDKSPVKLDDFGIMIQPMDVFRGSGTFQIFESDVAGGFIEYNRPISSISMNGYLNLGDVLLGDVYAGLQYKNFTGSSLMTVKTPEELPWIGDLLGLNGLVIGSAFTEINNNYFQNEIRIKKISLAQRLEFGKQGFPWFHYYLGKNLKKLYQIWKGENAGKQAIIFQIPENAGQVVIFALDTINPAPFDFSIQSPTGQIFNQENAIHYETLPSLQQTFMVIDKPMEGDWTFLTSYSGDITLDIYVLDQSPSLLVNEPGETKSRSSQISLSFNDFADTLNVKVYYNDNKRSFNGSFIQEFNIINNGTLDFVWQNSDVPNGEYYIYCRVDDGKNTPVLQYAPGSIWVENDTNIEIPLNFSAVLEDSTVMLSWDEPGLSNIFATTVYFRDLSTGRVDQEPIISGNTLTVNDLLPGRGYEVWAKFINDAGTYSQRSNSVEIEFASLTRNNPPYFRMNPDSAYVFIAGQEAQIQLLAQDADGDLITFSAPEALTGISIAGQQLNWTPTEDQRGVHRIMVVATDGAESDTTHLRLVVYTPQQLEISLALNSVKLYELDNNFVKINNFFCPEPLQNVTLINSRTQQQVETNTRRVNDFEYIGQFYLSSLGKSDLSVLDGDTIKAIYSWNNEIFETYGVYDINPQPSDLTPPGTISDLVAERLPNNRVKLSWTATGNDGEEGKAYRYDIRYAFEPINNESIYFSAHLIENYPYPSLSGETDTLIVHLLQLDGVTENQELFFAIKAEDEAQNRGGLSNSPAVECIPNPENVTATLSNVHYVEIIWQGPNSGSLKNTGFSHYNIYRKLNQGQYSLIQSNVILSEFTDNVKVLPDGEYQYAIEAVYESWTSEQIGSNILTLDRFIDVSILCNLDVSMDNEGISFHMIGLDDIYTQEFTRTTNTTGLVLLSKVFKGDYRVEISRDEYVTLVDTITVSDAQTNFLLTMFCDPASPSDLINTEVTAQSVVLGWTPVSIENQWQIIFGPEGFNPENEGNLVQEIFHNPFNLQGLMPGTTFDFYVRAVCGENTSEWTGPLSATTNHGILATASEGGTITPAGVTEITPGADYEYQISSYTGYHIEDVLVDGESAGAAETYLFENVSASHTIHAQFALNIYSVIALANNPDFGMVEGAGDYTHGQEVTLIAIPAQYYFFENWTENGIEVSTLTSYTFTAEANRELVANFEYATSIPGVSAQGPQVYPNPFSNRVTIKNAQNLERMQMTNLLGQVMIDKILSGSETERILTESLPKGIYIVTLIDKKGSREVIKMVKE